MEDYIEGGMKIMDNLTAPKMLTEKHKDDSTTLSKHMGELFTPAEVAGFLKVNLMTIYNWVKTGKLSCHVLTRGKRKTTVRFDLSQIEDFIQSKQRRK